MAFTSSSEAAASASTVGNASIHVSQYGITASTRVCWHMISLTQTPYAETVWWPTVDAGAAEEAAARCAKPAVLPLYGGASPRHGRWRRCCAYHSTSDERISSTGRSVVW